MLDGLITLQNLLTTFSRIQNFFNEVMSHTECVGDLN